MNELVLGYVDGLFASIPVAIVVGAAGWLASELQSRAKDASGDSGDSGDSEHLGRQPHDKQDEDHDD